MPSLLLFRVTKHCFLDARTHKTVPKKRFPGIKEMISYDFKTGKIVSSFKSQWHFC